MFFFDSLAIPPMAVGEVAEGSIRSGQDRSQIGKEIDRYRERERERDKQWQRGNRGRKSQKHKWRGKINWDTQIH
jgi:hypothetical protein